MTCYRQDIFVVIKENERKGIQINDIAKQTGWTQQIVQPILDDLMTDQLIKKDNNHYYPTFLYSRSYRPKKDYNNEVALET